MALTSSLWQLAAVCLVIGTAETFTHRLKLLYEKYLLAFEEVPGLATRIGSVHSCVLIRQGVILFPNSPFICYF